MSATRFSKDISDSFDRGESNHASMQNGFQWKNETIDVLMSTMKAPKPTLEILEGARVLFSSSGKWLHPLFEAEKWLDEQAIDPRRLTLRDNIVGKAAALLIVRLDIRRVEAGVLSKLGEGVLKKHEVSYSCAELVEKVLCRTEQELAEVEDPQEAYRILSGRLRGK
jgi:hypothetical protein